MSLALAGALLLHALLLLWISGARAPRPLRSMRVELLRTAPRAEAEKAPAQVIAVPPPKVAAEPPARSTSRPRPGKRAGESPAPPAQSPPAQASSSGAQGTAPLAARSQDWLAREGVAGKPLSLTLGPSSRAPQGPAREDGLVHERSPQEKLAEERATVARKVEGWLGDTRARDRAQSGRDVYWQSVEDALAHGFTPDWGMAGPREAERSRVGAFMEAWQKSAEAYGKSGSPSNGDPSAPGAPRPLQQEFISLGNSDRGLGGVSLGGAAASLGLSPSGGSAAGPWSHRLIALVRITQREDGSLFGAELLGKSGSDAYDRLALGQARKLGKLQLGPPQQGRETLWAFETDFTQVPPVPIAGCALDDFVPKDCFYPLQQRVKSRVRLQAIY